MEIINRYNHILEVPSSQIMTKNYPLGGIFEFNQAKILSRSGYKIGIISLNLDSLRFLFSRNVKMSYKIIDGVPIFRLNKKIFHIIRFGRHKKYILKSVLSSYEKLFNSYVTIYGKPDILHAHDLNYGGFYSNHIYNKYDIPYILTWHSSTIYNEYDYRTSNFELEKSVLKNARIVIAVSKAVSKFLKKRFGLTNVYESFNVLEPAFEFCSEKIKIQKNIAFTFISIGSLDENKNHKLLISAFSRSMKHKNCNLKIIGTGKLFDELNDLVDKLEMNKQIEFLGFCNRDEVINNLITSNCLVLSSKYETFGVVLIEALSLGLPVISTKCGGAEDIVNAENGILVNTDCTEEMEDAIKFMTKNIDKYDPQILRENVIKRFGINSFINDFTNILEQC